MPARLGAEYWRRRAEEARTQAAAMHPGARRALLDIAKNYEQLAEQAQRIAAPVAVPDKSIGQ